MLALRLMQELPKPQHLLLDELYLRQKKNPAYSRRAFARDVGVSPGFLSLLLTGHKNLSESRAAAMSKRLGWNAQRTRIFKQLIRCQGLTDSSEAKELAEEIRQKINSGEVSIFDVEAHQFQIIADWYHFAIVELATIEGFQDDPRWIAKRLKISAAKASEALARLQTVGLLERKGKKLVRGHSRYQVKTVPSKHIRSFHSQHLYNAEKALSDQPVDLREFMGVTVAINREKVEVAKKMIRNFIDEFSRAMEQGQRDQVYHLGMQFFSVDAESSAAKVAGQNDLS